jgi:hypothetical protein
VRRHPRRRPGLGPVGYQVVIGACALYTQWHHPALSTPWLWPARPPHDLGAALCATLVFTLGLTVITVRGAAIPPASQPDLLPRPTGTGPRWVTGPSGNETHIDQRAICGLPDRRQRGAEQIIRAHK